MARRTIRDASPLAQKVAATKTAAMTRFTARSPADSDSFCRATDFWSKARWIWSESGGAWIMAPA